MKISDGNTKTYEQCPLGTHLARCIKVIDLGTQKSEWKGVVKHTPQLLVSWEIPGELMSEGELAGKPFSVSKFYGFFLYEKSNLRKDLLTWRGKDFTEAELKENAFEQKTLLGKACMLSVGLGETGKTKVLSVMGVPKGMVVPAQINPSVYFSLETFTQESWDSVSKGIQGIIEKSPEYQAIKNGKPAPAPVSDESFDSDIPFN